MSNLNNTEAALLWTTTAALLVAILIEINPGFSQPLLDALYNWVVVIGPVVGAGFGIRQSVYSKDSVEKLMKGE